MPLRRHEAKRLGPRTRDRRHGRISGNQTRFTRTRNMNNLLKVGVLFLGRRRPGFDMDWGKQMEERVRQMLKRSTFSIFEPSEKAVDDASLRRCMAACE